MTAKPKRDSVDMEGARGQEGQIVSMLVAAGQAVVAVEATAVPEMARAAMATVVAAMVGVVEATMMVAVEATAAGVWRCRLTTVAPRLASRETLPLFDEAHA